MTTPDEGSRIDAAARRIDEKAQSLGHEAEAAANRFAARPGIQDAADAAARLWGLVLLAIGLWFFASVTLRIGLPDIAWADLWPAILIVFGGLIVVRGLARRR